MNLLDINFKKVHPDALQTQLFNNQFTPPSRKVFDELLCHFSAAIEKADYLTSQNISIACLFFNEKQYFKYVKKSGLFRYSRYIHKKCIIKAIAQTNLNYLKKSALLTPDSESYLSTVINFESIFHATKQIDQIILKEIKIFEKKYKGRSFLRTILAYVDYLFFTHHQPTDKNLFYLSGRTKEEISSAASFIIHTYTRRVSTSATDIYKIAEDYIMSGEIAVVLKLACYYSDFREFEILVDHFGYQCLKANKILKIQAPYEDLEKSIRLGYIRSDIQQYNDLISAAETFEKAVTYDQLIEYLDPKSTFTFVPLVTDNNYPRYRLEIPDDFYDFMVDHFIKNDELFKEEVLYLSHIFKELILYPEDLDNLIIKDNLSLRDFTKMMRFFHIWQYLLMHKIKSLSEIDTVTFLRSLSIMMTESSLLSIAQKLLPEDKVNSFLDIVCWEPHFDFIFDLQYHPTIFIEDFFLIPLNILCNSNSIRNMYASQYKRQNKGLMDDGSQNRLVKRFMHVLTHQSITCYAETNLGFTDIDVLAVLEDTLFIFECKHSLQPTNVFDLRTPYDHILKAEHQLNQIMHFNSKGKLLSAIEQRHHIDLSSINHVIATIVLSNRIFHGNAFKYPVRNFNELAGMIYDGTATTEDGSYLLWENEKLTAKFLRNYLSHDSEIIKSQFNTLSPKIQRYEITEPAIEFHTFSMNMENAREKFREFTNKLKRKQNK